MKKIISLAGIAAFAASSTLAFAETMLLAAPEIAAMVPLFDRADVPALRAGDACTYSFASMQESGGTWTISHANAELTLNSQEAYNAELLRERYQFDTGFTNVNEFTVVRHACTNARTNWYIE